MVIAAEITKNSIPLAAFSQSKANDPIAIIFGNEVDGVLDSTLKLVDAVVHIPMQGIKESINVGQTSAIFMREFSNG
jgi:tRNA G18 (ribose-2'-O)-methylase SpoU